MNVVKLLQEKIIKKMPKIFWNLSLILNWKVSLKLRRAREINITPFKANNLNKN